MAKTVELAQNTLPNLIKLGGALPGCFGTYYFYRLVPKKLVEGDLGWVPVVWRLAGPHRLSRPELFGAELAGFLAQKQFEQEVILLLKFFVGYHENR